MQQAAVNVYSARAARWVGGLALLSLLASFWLVLSPETDSAHASRDADGYSRAAMGHLGFVRLLRELGEPVRQLRVERELKGCGLLVLAEPRELAEREVARLKDRIDEAPATLLVLRKRIGVSDPLDPPDDPYELVALDDANEQLRQLADRPHRAPSVLRKDATTAWRSEHGWPLPTLQGSVQLLEPRDEVEALVRCNEGVLLGRVDGLHVLSDPDLIANHGLHRGDNAALSVAIVRGLRSEGQVVFDETIHGHLLQPSIWKAAGRFPFVLVPAHLLLLLALTLWIARGRFGKPLPVPPAIDAGKGFLIDNIAALLRRGGKHGPSLRRYQRLRVRRAAELLHAPKNLSDDAYREWLLQRIPDPALRQELEGLLQRSSEELPRHRAVAVAQRIRTLTEDMHAVH